MSEAFIGPMAAVVVEFRTEKSVRLGLRGRSRRVDFLSASRPEAAFIAGLLCPKKWVPTKFSFAGAVEDWTPFAEAHVGVSRA